MVRFAERPAADRAAADGHDVFRIGHLVVEALQHGSHLRRDGSAHKDHVGLARTVTRHFETEAGDVVARGADGHEFDAATARGERQRPERVAPSPVDEVVEFADDDVGTAGVELFDEFFEGLVVFELVVGDRLDLRAFCYCHLSAPFLQA